MSDEPLGIPALREQLEAIVDRVLTVRRSVDTPAMELAVFDRATQQRFLDAGDLISKTSVELAWNFCCFATPALPRMYGGAHFTVISEVEKLPMKVSDIYRRITC